MDTDQLRQFSEIVKCGTVSEAARSLHITQPALSRSLKRLEDELGCKLFDRAKNSITLNDTGRFTLEYAQDILRSERKIKNGLQQRMHKGHTVRIGTCAPAPLWFLTSTIVGNFPGTIVDSTTMNTQKLEDALTNGEIDIAITTNPTSSSGIHTCPFMEEHLSVMVPPDHPLASKQSVCFKDLDGEPFLIYADIGFWWNVCRKHLPHTSFVRQKDRVLFQQMEETSDLLTFATSAPITVHRRNDRVSIPIDDPASHATFYFMTDEENKHAMDLCMLSIEHLSDV